MHVSTLNRRAFLARVAGVAAGRLNAQGNGTPPPGLSGPVTMKSDRLTLLLGDEAAITGGLRPGIVGDGCKRLQVRSWNTADDSFTWQVDVPASGELVFVVDFLVGAGAGIGIPPRGHATTKLCATGRVVNRAVRQGHVRILR